MSLLTIFMVLIVLGAYLFAAPQVPAIDSLKNVKFQTPMRIYTSDDQLIGEFGDVRRIPVTLEQIPADFVNALVATEDKRFFEHDGVDLQGLLRVIKVGATTGSFSEGASTLTMQTARNMFLNRDRRLKRKLVEMFLALRMEEELSKEEILELYINKVHFSHRAYGLGAAAQVYYGKDLTELTLPQSAMMAGLLKGESIYNPISNPPRAIERRNLVLTRMRAEEYITQEDFDLAIDTPLTASKHTADLDLNAPYVAELARLHVIKTFGRDRGYNDGIVVHTTLDSKHQLAANSALHQGLLSYDRRHGYKGAELTIEDFASRSHDELLTILRDTPSVGGLIPAIVTQVNEQDIQVLTEDERVLTIAWDGMKWAAKFISDSRIGHKPKVASDIVTIGDLIRIRGIPLEIAEADSAVAETEQALDSNLDQLSSDPENSDLLVEQSTEPMVEEPIEPEYEWHLAQVPEASSGFVSLDPQNGAITSLVGGFDYLSNKFNLVTQARRQPGSNIKPFIYASALNKGFTAASLVTDAPYVRVNEAIDEIWRPQNDNLKYNGPTRLRIGLKRSINTISIRLIDAIGADYAERYMVNLGLPDEHMDPYQSIALGSASFTPLEVAAAYAILANGGYKVDPHYIQSISSSDGEFLYQATPKQVCKECAQLKISAQLEAERSNQTIDSYDEYLPIPEEQIAPLVMDARDAFVIYDMMKDVIRSGTATTQLKRRNSHLLARRDLAGKTGTANDYKDAWFSGFNNALVGSAWMGFSDHRRSLGKFEYGGKAALPIWAMFMEDALENQPERKLQQPAGVVSAKIDPTTGKLAALGQTNAIFEYFRDDMVPTEVADSALDETGQDLYNFEEEASEDSLEDLFNENSQSGDDKQDENVPVEEPESIF